MSGVSNVSAAQGAQASQSTSSVRENDGKMVLSFKGEKIELSKKQADQYNEILYNLNYTKNRISELKDELGKGVTAERKAEIQAELKPLKEQYAKQQATASFDILPSASGDMFVAFNVKKDINAEDFKKLFNLEDGALRYSLKKDALSEGIGLEKTYTRDVNAPFESYDEAIMSGGLPFEFSNGVVLVEDGDTGHYYPDYTGAELYAGSTYNVAGSKVGSPEAKPWWKFW